MKKADMEFHHQAYHSALSAAITCESQGLYRQAMQMALSAWEHIDGMMQFARKYENDDSPRVAAIDLVLRYAPLLLDKRCLEKLSTLLAEVRRISRDAATDVPEALQDAGRHIANYHRLWKQLETAPAHAEQDLQRHLGETPAYWTHVLDSWTKMGIVRKQRLDQTVHFSLVTRRGQVVRGKCPGCGTVSEAPKAMFFEPNQCAHCKSVVSFVILA